MQKFWLSFFVLIILIAPSSLFAQEISPQTKKSVIKNFKANLAQYSALGEDCSRKSEGDANCDALINDFDLSIWQVEFSATNSPKRSDFNNDGQINLLDFGIWRNTQYPSRTSSLLNRLYTTIASLFNFKSSTVYAQTTNPITNSQALISGSGNGLISNLQTNGNTQQVLFDPNGNLISSVVGTSDGQLLATLAYLSSGTTIINTQEDGVAIQIAKTNEGPVIEGYRNPDGTLITIKSWPNQQAYETSQPPASVTLPGRDGTLLTLNIQPNGGGILNHTDINGKILSQNQIIGGTYYGSYDVATDTRTEVVNPSGYTSLNMPNSLGGKTTYYFYQNYLVSISQTNSTGGMWIANPKGGGYDSWELVTRTGGQEVRKTVADPIKALNSNTPSPLDLLNDWNRYLVSPEAQNTVPEINFTDSFTSNTQLTAQASKADQVYKIEQVPPSNVLGIIKEAFAQATVEKQSTSAAKDGVAVQVTGFTGTDGQTNMTISVFGPGATGGAAQNPLGASTVTVSAGTSIPDVTGMSPTQAMSAVQQAAAAGNAQTAPNAQPLTSLPTVPADPAAAPPAAVPAAPAAPAAAPAAPAAAPAAPAAAAKDAPWTDDQKGAYTAAGDAAAKAASGLAAGATSEQRGQAAREAASESLKDAVSRGLFSPGFAGEIADRTFIDSFLSTQGIGLNQGTAPQVQQAINALNTQRNNEHRAPTGLKADTFNAPAAAPAAAPAPPPPPPTGAAGAGQPQGASAGSFPGYPTPGQVQTGTYNGFNVSTVFDPVSGGWDSTITNPATGATVANFQDQHPQTASGVWNDSTRGYSFDIKGDAISSITDQNGNVFSIAPNNHITTTRSNGEVTAADVSWFNAMITERNDADGNSQRPVDQKCFLAGTLVSTVNGPKPIETLKSGDKVYSYNEQTGQKQISDFKKLDINFVDEYLVINNQIKTTVYHPFYVLQNKELKTIRADKLQLGDILQNEDGKQVPVSSIEKISAPKTTVYNLLNVSPNSNFFAENILVHNYGDEDSDGDGSWSAPDLDADPNATGASADDPGTSYTSVDRPDMVQGPNGPEPAQQQTQDYSGNWSGGQFGGSAGGGEGGGSGLGKSSAGSGDWGQPAEAAAPAAPDAAPDANTGAETSDEGNNGAPSGDEGASAGGGGDDNNQTSGSDNPPGSDGSNTEGNY